jgi:20S proteasome alpha/beta subunit
LIAQNFLFANKQKHFTYYQVTELVESDMTYILGARCSDGVVLVGDTKITLGGGTQFTYGKKLFKPFTSVVMGAAGISGLYSSFQNRMQVKVSEQEGCGINLNDHAKLKTLAENVIREMHKTYELDRNLLVYNLNVLMGIRVFYWAELTNFSGYGIPEPVNSTKVIGHGEPYGALFIDRMWNKNMTMEQVAKLGLFIIKLIQYTKIDSSVGYNTEFLPQVYYIPDVKFPKDFTANNTPSKKQQKIIAQAYAKYPIRELPYDEVSHLLNEVSSKVSDFENLFKQGQFKL